MKIICVGNYPPRQCGIATFTENLVRAILNAAEIHAISIDLEVIAMNDYGKTYLYPEIVKHTIRANEKSDYYEMSNYINDSGADLILLQHEFGIYGGESSVFLLGLLRRLKIPIVTTFHTVLENPSFHQYEVLRKIAGYSNQVVIMNSLAIKMLTDVYHIRRNKINCIEHGVPDFELLHNHSFQSPKEWGGKKVILTFGLIGRSKGIETVIRALPAIVSKFPNIIYVVLGKTHPSIVLNSGEEYREYLTSLVKNLNLIQNVVFINEYVSELDLMAYLKRADIYVTPYHNKAQITSGTLSYAVSGGCAVISTPYWHAEQLLADGRGRLFDFGDSAQLAEIVNELLEQPASLKLLQQKALNYGKTISWPLIGKEYLDLFKHTVQFIPDVFHPLKNDLEIIYPEFDITYLKRLTDDSGLLQHAKMCIPYFKAGYSIDDNARAIIVCVEAWRQSKEVVYIDLLNKYLSYLTYMQLKDGSFANYMTYERSVLEAKSDDAYGRIIWAIGYLIRYAPTNSHFHLGLDLFENALPQFARLTYARGYANCILGLYHYVKRFPDQERFLNLLTTVTNQLCDKYINHKRDNWHWFEDSITYDNGLLPAALYRSYQILGNEKYLEIATESRLFLESKCFREEWLSLIGNRKWLHLDQDYDIFAQQPTDAMSMIILYQCAFEVSKDIEDDKKLHLCFDWFFGKNDLDISLYDWETKGCNDGIEATNINRNQGAESNIAYLLSYLIAKPLPKLRI